ncbi:NACHT and WD repeat domain-containing protein [Streptosporangium sp. NPDC049644]|uniref:NACHT and WD repeat domain-containing protein n=1 Tax=Streptosporangium sp. NPDC049644 TaxID=3155507 RepID=UPI00342C05AC
MNGAQDPRDEQHLHFDAQASGSAQVNQAGRDIHLYYRSGTRNRRRVVADPTAVGCPYPGLAAFTPDRAEWFFGRDYLIADLIGRMDLRLRTGGLQIVIGPSGAGKSSLLQAGLVAELKASALPGSLQWSMMLITPGADPLGVLATEIAGLAGRETGDVASEVRAAPATAAAIIRTVRPTSRVVIVVDQFEELFTQGADETERTLFIQALATLAERNSEGEAIALVVLGIRADYFAACNDYPVLRRALEDTPLLVGAMSEDELREAIIFPAESALLEIESGLPEILLRDLGTTSRPGSNGVRDYEAGKLPLLAHALRAAWQRKSGSRLTIEGYEATGGIARAIEISADHTLAGLTPEGRAIAAQVFVRLVKISDESQDTRRRLPAAELRALSSDPHAVDIVISAFTGARLLSTDQDTVEITHDALLYSWPALRNWINGDRDDRLVQQGLEDAAAAWIKDEDASLLYRGARLTMAESWASRTAAPQLSPGAHRFLTSSIRQHRRARRLRTILATTLVLLTVLSVGAAGFAFLKQREAVTERNLAVYARLLAEADRLQPIDVSLSAQLSLAAHRMRPSDETYTRLLATQNAALGHPLAGHTDDVEGLAWRSDGRVLASAGHDNTVRLWDVTDPTRPAPLGRPLSEPDKVTSVAFSPDGRTLASGGFGKGVRLWNVSDPAQATQLGKPLEGSWEIANALAWSPDGRTLVALASGRLHIWDVSDPERPAILARPVTAHTSAAYHMKFSPDSRTLVTSGTDEKVQLWDMSDRRTPTALGEPIKADSSAVDISFDGLLLATTWENAIVRLWSLVDRAKPQSLGFVQTSHTNTISSVAFSPTAPVLATASNDQTVQLWNVGNPADITAIGQPMTGHGNSLNALAFSPDGASLATSAAEDVIRMWTLPRTRVLGQTGGITSLRFTSRGKALASVAGDGTVRLWDTSWPGRVPPLGVPLNGIKTILLPHLSTTADGAFMVGVKGLNKVQIWDVSVPAKPVPQGEPLSIDTLTVTAAIIAPDGKLLATGDADGRISLWDVSVPAVPKLIIRSAPQSHPLVDMAFSPDGATIAAAYGDGVLRRWKADAGNGLRQTGQEQGSGSYLFTVVFSPDGRTVAGVSGDKSVRFWDFSDPASLRSLGAPLEGHKDTVSALAFTPDGRTMASVSQDRSIRLWDLTDRSRPVMRGQAILGHGRSVETVAFSPDGTNMATAGSDNVIFLWSLRTRDVVDRVCALTADLLTPAQWRIHVGESIPYDPPCPASSRRPAPTVESPVVPDDPSGLIGIWQGTYTCPQGLTSIRLRVSRAPDQRSLVARTDFGTAPGGPSVPKGTFMMRGAITNGVLTLKGDHWVKQPLGYQMIDLSAQVNGSRPDQISGQVETSGGECTTFMIHRS